MFKYNYVFFPPLHLRACAGAWSPVVKAQPHSLHWLLPTLHPEKPGSIRCISVTTPQGAHQIQHKQEPRRLILAFRPHFSCRSALMQTTLPCYTQVPS